MILDLGLVDYGKSYRIQKELVARRRLGEIEDSVILAEHPPVFTIGRIGKKENLLVDEEALKTIGISLVDVDRGGDITFHGPGQIVAYPIITLEKKGRDLHRYLRDLESVIISFLSGYSVRGEAIKDRTGVWVGGKKIASIGIAASNWVTYHGISININVDLRFFSMIHPCGLKDVEMTSLSRVLNREVALGDAKERLLNHLKYTFDFGECPFDRKNAALA